MVHTFVNMPVERGWKSWTGLLSSLEAGELVAGKGAFGGGGRIWPLSVMFRLSFFFCRHTLKQRDGQTTGKQASIRRRFDRRGRTRGEG